MEEALNLILRLPREKQPKGHALVDRRVALHAAIPTDRVSAAYERRDALQAERVRIAEFVAQAGRRPDDQERLKSIDDSLQYAEAEIIRLKKLRDRASEVWTNHGNIVRHCLDYLRSSTAPIKAARAPVVKLKAGETFAEAIAAVRAEWERALAERQGVELSVAPTEQLVAETLAALDHHAARGKPDLDRRIRGRDPMKLDRHLEHANLGVDFIMWAIRDVIAEKLTSLIGPRDPSAVTDKNREQQLAAIDARLLDLERTEEALIVAAEAIGQTIERRPDASVIAILEIEG